MDYAETKRLLKHTISRGSASKNFDAGPFRISKRNDAKQLAKKLLQHFFQSTLLHIFASG